MRDMERRFRMLWMAVLAAAVTSISQPAHAAELIMFEQKGCEWCEVWDEKIAPVYPKTAEGERAPLRRVDIHAPAPPDIAHIRSGAFTPTFVLVDDGREIGRIRGYPGEDFFWGMLQELIEKLSDEVAGRDVDPY